jgi:HEAT repeat protein
VVRLAPGVPERVARRAEEPEGRGPSLRERFGAARGERLLGAPDVATRLRGIERLARQSGRDAWRALAEALDGGTAIRSDPRTRLRAVRALAPHAAHEEARRVLAQILDAAPADGTETPLENLARATAALALARAGTDEALTTLGAAIVAGGAASEPARAALLAHPPKVLGPVARGRVKALPLGLIELMGDLGDVRAIPLLRRQLGGEVGVRAAVVALGKLGDGSVAERARKWALPREGAPSGSAGAAGPPKRASEAERELLLGAAETLSRLGTADAPALAARLLASDDTRRAALALARRAPFAPLVPALEAIARDGRHAIEERVAATEILGRIGDEAAVTALLGLLATPELALAAAHGLARSSSPSAVAGLERALASAGAGAPRRLVLRAALVRFLERGEAAAGLEGALAPLLQSADAADRALAAFGLRVLGWTLAESASAPREAATVAAEARAALALGPRALLELAPVLERHAGDEPNELAIAAAPVLLVANDVVPTARLARWAEGGGPLAPLAALRLAARDSRPFRPRLEALLAGTSADVRVHVAIGLADSAEPDAAALLARAYAEEADVMVRRAAVGALGRRSEELRLEVLRLAARFDPDAGVRAMAREGLAGRARQSALPAGREVAWVQLRATGEAERAGLRPIVVVRADGVALPVLADPDGVALVPGLADGGGWSVRP